MTDALLDIQQDLAKLQIQLAKAPQGSTGAAGAVLKATLQKVDSARQIVRPSAPSAKTKGMPAAPTSPATRPATKSDADGT
jgi:hypothetical protein